MKLPFTKFEAKLTDTVVNSRHEFRRAFIINILVLMRDEGYKKTGFWLFVSQFIALMIKKALYIKRSWGIFLVQVSESKPKQTCHIFNGRI